MDFKTIRDIKKQASLLTGDRHSTSEAACAKGVALLQHIAHREPVDKALVKEAHSHFIKAIQYNRKLITPYVGISYLLLFLGDTSTARKYLQEGLKLEPENEEVQTLLKYITAKETGKLTSKTTAAQTTSLAPSNEPNYDELYDKLEAFISRQTFRTNSVVKKLKPSPQPQAIEELNKLQQEFETAYQDIQQQMQVLDAEFDLGELQQSLGPLESSISLVQKHLALSQRMLDILTHIQQESRHILLQLQSLPTELSQEQVSEHECRLDTFLDHCDHIADQLDDLDQAGHGIEELEPPYQSLIQQVEKLRDALDDVKS